MESVLSLNPKPVDRYLEDVVVGEGWSSEPVEITAGDIREFAALYEPHSLDADEAEAQSGEPGGALVASGWHLVALAMREFVRARTLGNTPVLGMGADDIRWLKPVRAGFVLTFHREISDIRRSISKPDRGVITTELLAVDQDGDIVMKMRTLTRIPSRLVTAKK
jgi:acyl dehydratase